MLIVLYGVITNTNSNNKKLGKYNENQESFNVELIETPSISGDGIVTATISSESKRQGTIKATGLTTKGDEVVVKYTVKNKSTEMEANLKAEATNTNENYFDIECSLEKQTIKAQEETILTVILKLIKTPVDESKGNVTSNITITASLAETTKKYLEDENSNDENSEVITAVRAYIPTGFTQVEGTTLENGLTIQDSTGNQYVWIEVPKTVDVYSTSGLEITEFTDEEYIEIETDLHTYASDYRDENNYKDEYYSDEVTGLTSEQYTELKQKMLKSVYQNGGFFIGKYETGIENEPKTSGSSSITPIETPVIKQNAYPYNYVTCSQAQKLANGMESGDKTSSLLFGIQWDLVLKYLETKGTSKENLKTDSTMWGNYKTNMWSVTNEKSKYALNGFEWTSGAYGTKTSVESILLSTGASDNFSKQGIYDFAGNVYELTLEYPNNPDYPVVSRGGKYIDGNIDSSASIRGIGKENDCSRNIGFRVAIY